MVKKKKRFKDFEEALIFLCIFECANTKTKKLKKVLAKKYKVMYNEQVRKK